MAYNEGLAIRMRKALIETPEIIEKRMFGGIGFMLHGNLACGVIKDDLISRVGTENYGAALAKPHTKPFGFTGRPMKGWIAVGPEGYGSDYDLKGWVQIGVDFAGSLPAK